MSSVDKVALDYFDASINRISAWVVGFRNFQKALLNALLTPNETLKQLQDEGRMTELMVKQEEIKTLPFGDVWAVSSFFSISPNHVPSFGPSIVKNAERQKTVRGSGKLRNTKRRY